MESALSFITAAISTGGYPALFILTFLDSTVLPVPNEAIMPFAGFLISQGRFSFLGVLLISAIGGALGALTSYAIGWYGATPFVHRFGQYLRISQRDLNKTHAVFETYGDRIILISRFIPVVRQFISIPAGAARMKIAKFCAYTAIGSTLWNAIIAVAGYQFGAHWEATNLYSDMAGKILLVLFALFIGWRLYRMWQKRNKEKNNSGV